MLSLELCHGIGVTGIWKILSIDNGQILGIVVDLVKIRSMPKHRNLNDYIFTENICHTTIF